MPLAPGTHLGHYEIVELIGKGGMGEVYRAHDPRTGRDVAVKVSAEHFSERFTREVRAVAALNHPNVCTLYDVGPDYLVMELLEGKTLRDYIGGEGVDSATAIALGAQIADALEAAHAKGIVHRDIKPGNIFVTGRRHVKVLDFGLAKRVAVEDSQATRTLDSLTVPGSVVGTLHYLSPEVLRGLPADARSDLWSFGVVLYEMVTGSRPFDGATTFEISSSILKEQAPDLPSQVSAGMRAVIHRCLAKEPAERYQRASEVRAALEAVSAATPAPISRRGWLWAAGGAATLGAAAVVWRLWPKQAAALPGLVWSRSKSSDANDYFERAMLYLRVQDDLTRGRQMLEKALELDPHFAEAHRWYGFTHILMIDKGRSNDTSWLYKAEDEFRRASQDDPELASIHSALACLYFYQGRYELLRSEVAKALESRPVDQEAETWLAIFQMLSGEYAAAMDWWNEVLDREPLFAPARWNRADILRQQGNFAEAVREMKNLLDQSPESIYAISKLGVAYLDAGNLAEARRTLERGRGLDPKNFQLRTIWAALLALEGKPREAVEEMDAGVLKYAEICVLFTSLVAEVYALVGDRQKALDWLETAVRKGDDRAEWFRRDPFLASLRHDEPRFQQILSSIESRKKLGVKQ
jgi:serine/threonine protein kinase/Flp pilus assembly protein TadD